MKPSLNWNRHAPGELQAPFAPLTRANKQRGPLKRGSRPGAGRCGRSARPVQHGAPE